MHTYGKNFAPQKNSEEIDRYIDFWLTQNRRPKTIGWLHRLVEMFGGAWAPNNLDLYIKRTNEDCQWAYFRTIPASKTGTLRSGNKLHLIFLEEIKHRIHRSIYNNNLFDHLMPIEVKTFWPSENRKAKISFTVVVSIVMYLIFIFGTSALYGTMTPGNAVYQTYSGEHTNYVLSKKLRSVIASNLKNNATYQATINNGQKIEAARKFCGKLPAKFHSQIERDAEELGFSFAKKETLERKKQAITDTCSMLVYATFVSKQGAYYSVDGIIVTASNNALEIASQVSIVLFIVILLNIFFSMKNSFYEIVKPLNFKAQTEAIEILDNVISINFFNRRKFHYCIAIFSVFAVLSIHFYFIGEFQASASERAAEAVGLTAYDYRTDTTYLPLFLVQWFLQGVIVFSIAMISWETKTLNDCIRTVQQEFSMKFQSQSASLDEAFKKVKHKQTNTLAMLAIFILLLQGFISLTKLSDSRLKGTNLDVSEVIALADWALLWNFIYVLSPLLVFLIITKTITKFCYVSVSDAQKGFQKQNRSFDEKMEEVVTKADQANSSVQNLEKKGLFKRLGRAMRALTGSDET